MKEYLKTLNEKQFCAAGHREGPALVLAGPGSGKTSVITARTISLIDLYGIDAVKLLTVTFSRAAAMEMKNRYIKLIGKYGLNGIDIPEYGTLHGFCYRALKTYSDLFSDKKILSDEKGKNKILTEIWFKVNSPKDRSLANEYIEIISNAISKIKSFKDSEKEKLIRRDIQVRNFDDIYAEYELYKKKNGFIDFDDMISETAGLIKEDKVFLANISSKYDYIQIDEGQDMSFGQIEIVKAIGKHGNVFMVADDDQGIYGFRGADVKAVNYFENSFKGCKKYFLEQNYRSVSNIVNVASELVKRNSGRYSKNLFTLNEKGSDIELIRIGDCIKQARFAAEIALANSAAGYSSGILYRSNISALMPLLLLYHHTARSGIKASVSIAGGFFHPKKYGIIDCYMKTAEKEQNRNGIITKSPYAIYKTMERTGKVKEFRERCSLKGQSEKNTEYILSFLKNLTLNAKCQEEVEAFFKYIEGIVMSEDYSGSKEGQTDKQSDGGIFLSTVHSSKGLEYDCVIIIDATDEDFPKKTATEKDELEEERRLFYVAMTRAKKKLYIVSPDKCGAFEFRPGLFFRETAEVLKA